MSIRMNESYTTKKKFNYNIELIWKNGLGFNDVTALKLIHLNPNKSEVEYNKEHVINNKEDLTNLANVVFNISSEDLADTETDIVGSNEIEIYYKKDKDYEYLTSCVVTLTMDIIDYEITFGSLDSIYNEYPPTSIDHKKYNGQTNDFTFDIDGKSYRLRGPGNFWGWGIQNLVTDHGSGLCYVIPDSIKSEHFIEFTLPDNIILKKMVMKARDWDETDNQGNVLQAPLVFTVYGVSGDTKTQIFKYNGTWKTKDKNISLVSNNSVFNKYHISMETPVGGATSLSYLRLMGVYLNAAPPPAPPPVNCQSLKLADCYRNQPKCEIYKPWWSSRPRCRNKS